MAKKSNIIREPAIYENEVPRIDLTKLANHRHLSNNNSLKLLKEISNVEFSNIREYKKFRKDISKSGLEQTEQDWVDYYLQPIINFMGTYGNWKIAIPFEFLIVESSAGTVKGFEDLYVIRFTGAHWYSKKPGDKKWFDPYTEYQYQGSNQFCQTYALMYMLDELPDRVDKEEYNNFTKYYYYSKKAIEFIKKFYIPSLKKSKKRKFLYLDSEEDIKAKSIKDIEMRIDELLKFFYMTVNCIELTNFD